MSFCSFASLVGGACGPSTENPSAVQFLQEYLTAPLDKKPARQAGIELAGKVKH